MILTHKPSAVKLCYLISQSVLYSQLEWQNTVILSMQPGGTVLNSVVIPGFLCMLSWEPKQRKIQILRKTCKTWKRKGKKFFQKCQISKGGIIVIVCTWYVVWNACNYLFSFFFLGHLHFAIILRHISTHFYRHLIFSCVYYFLYRQFFVIECITLFFFCCLLRSVYRWAPEQLRILWFPWQ